MSKLTVTYLGDIELAATCMLVKLSLSLSLRF
jgi:hypothetical protein